MRAKITSFFQRDGAILIIALAALAMRLHHLIAENVWFDEFCSIRAAYIMPELIMQGRFVSVAGPVGFVYFLCLRVWMFLSGHSVYAVRLLSVLFGVAGIYAVYELGVRLYNRSVGVLAAGLLTMHAGHWYHSQDARQYTLFLLLTVLLFILFDRYAEKRRPRLLGLMVVTEVLLVNTHFFGIFTVFVIQVLYRVYPRASDGKNWYRYHGWGMLALGILSLLYVQMAINQRANISAIQPQSLLLTGRDIAQWLAYGGNEFAERYISIPMISRWLAPLVMTIAALVGIGTWGTRDRRRMMVVLLWLAMPLAALLLISALWRPVLLQRHIFNLTPAYLLLVAAGIYALWDKYRVLGIAMLCGVLIAIAPALWALETQAKRFPMQRAAETVRRLHQKGDVILLMPSYCWSYFAFFLNPEYALRRESLSGAQSNPYARGQRTAYVTAYGGEGDERFWFFLGDDLFASFEDARAPGPEKPIYIMAYDTSLQRFFAYYPSAMYPERLMIIAVNQWARWHDMPVRFIFDKILPGYYRPIFSQTWNNKDISLWLFERKEPPAGQGK